MAKIDTSRIEGYTDMTAEQKLAALEGFEYDDGATEIERYKNAASKANSEAAEWKKKHNALLSEEERKKAESDEELASLRTQVEELTRRETIAAHKASYLALGYDEALATETAEALMSGDTEKVFANQKKFLETHDRATLAELQKRTPKPPAGGEGASSYETRLAEARKSGNTAEAVAIKREAAENGLFLM